MNMMHQDLDNKMVDAMGPLEDCFRKNSGMIESWDKHSAGEFPESDNPVEYEVDVAILEDNFVSDIAQGKWGSLVFQNHDQLGNHTKDNQVDV